MISLVAHVGCLWRLPCCLQTCLLQLLGCDRLALTGQRRSSASPPMPQQVLLASSCFPPAPSVQPLLWGSIGPTRGRQDPAEKGLGFSFPCLRSRSDSHPFRANAQNLPCDARGIRVTEGKVRDAGRCCCCPGNSALGSRLYLLSVRSRCQAGWGKRQHSTLEVLPSPPVPRPTPVLLRCTESTGPPCRPVKQGRAPPAPCWPQCSLCRSPVTIE